MQQYAAGMRALQQPAEWRTTEVEVEVDAASLAELGFLVLIVDGRDGVVIVNPDEETIRQYEAYGREFIALEHKLDAIREEPAVTRDGTAVERVTYTAGFDGLPSFSADGKKLLWTSSRGGDTQVWVADWVD